ncbi:MAG: GSCFA domain-containing protein [Bacteroidetes bacterium]|nr:GSCFA domain-containing protein [Bacteroidota bacterium]
MNNFRTVVKPTSPSFHISHADSLISIGSCFSENIGKKFQDRKFNSCINPFGQQYNPYSIANSIQRLLNGKPYAETDLVYHDELYHSYDHHGSFSRSTKGETLEVINMNLKDASAALKSATVLFLTFGTSHVFSLKEGQIVSNCHKLSGNNFDKRLMKPNEIVEVLAEAISKLRTVNRELRIILTISPVRYFAFGHYENSVSKAHLFTAIHELRNQFPDLYYFPAYELVMDDLRDYRFFSEDMLHPNYQATDYVWQSFADTFFSKATIGLVKEVEEIIAAVKHRPRNAKSEAHKKFVEKYLKKAGELQKQKLDFTEEQKLFLLALRS